MQLRREDLTKAPQELRVKPGRDRINSLVKVWPLRMESRSRSITTMAGLE